jgi:anaerobic magnesium-protoporphyrin IX monomethyl ester cyclase
MRKEDILLIVNPSLWSSNMYSSGILCLSAYLQKNNFDNIIVDSAIGKQGMGQEAKEKAVFDFIKEKQPKVVCFSSTHREFDEVIRMNDEIKRCDKRIFTIVGGPQPTYRPADFMDNGFDFVGIGEGEVTLFEFVREVFSGSHHWGAVKGLYWKNSGQVTRNPARPLMSQEELDEMPPLPYHKIDKRYFDIDVRMVRGLPIKGGLLMTTRGCPFSCSYCGCNLIFGKKLRSYSMEHIEREVRCLKEEYGIEGIWIADDTLTVSKDHAIGVAGILKKYGLVWGCQSRVDAMSEELGRVMKDAGCVQIDFGVESGSPRILDSVIGKRISITQIEDAFRISRKYKLRTLANFMIGFPTEQYEDLKMTESLADRIKADVYIFSIATPLPGTRLYDMVNEKITPQEYYMLDWNGSPFMEKVNKSGLANLNKERLRLEKKYFFSTVVKSLFSVYILTFFINRRYKYSRIKCIIRYLSDYFVKKVFSEKGKYRTGGVLENRAVCS